MNNRNMFDRYLNTKNVRKKEIKYGENSDSEVEI